MSTAITIREMHVRAISEALQGHPEISRVRPASMLLEPIGEQPVPEDDQIESYSVDLFDGEGNFLIGCIADCNGGRVKLRAIVR